MANEIQKVTIKALFTKNKAVFMLQSPDGKWELPGGTMYFGETPEDTLKRELKEELDLSEPSIGSLVNVFNIRTSYKTTKYQFVAIVYKCEADLSKAKISDEHTQSEWIEFDQLEKYEMLDGYKESIETFFNVETSANH